MLKRLSLDAKFHVFLLVASATALIFILLTTSKYGAGVSSDAARNLSTADSLLAGKGFVDMLGSPFVLWPPLYPLVMAGLSRATGWSTFQSAWYLNVALYVIDIWLSGWLLYQVFKTRLVYAVAGTLVILLSRSTLRIYANVASEPLFATFMLLFFLVAARYLKHPSAAASWGMFILAGLATLQRYLGLVLFGVALVAVFHKQRWRGILVALLPGVFSTLPIAAWAIGHNIPISGAPFGPRDVGEMLPLQNMTLSLTKIFWWFVPRLSFTDPLLLHPWIVILIILLMMFLLGMRSGWAGWLHSVSDPYVWPGLLFALTYFFLLAFTVVTADHLDLTSDRYYVVILPVIVVLLFLTLDALVLNRLQRTRPRASYILAALLAIWFIYPVYSLDEYLREALVKGEPTNYNIANSSQFREMKVVRAAEPILASHPNATVYSNYVNVVWFIFHHPVRTLPFQDATLPPAVRLAQLRRDYAAWPPEGGYIIWFTPNQYHHIVDPADLATIAQLQLLHQDKTGQIFWVGPSQ